MNSKDYLDKKDFLANDQENISEYLTTDIESLKFMEKYDTSTKVKLPMRKMQTYSESESSSESDSDSGINSNSNLNERKKIYKKKFNNLKSDRSYNELLKESLNEINEFPNLPPNKNKKLKDENLSKFIKRLNKENKSINDALDSDIDEIIKKIREEEKKIKDKEKINKMSDQERYRILKEKSEWRDLKIKCISGIISVSLMVPIITLFSHSPISMALLGLSPRDYKKIGNINELPSNIMDNDQIFENLGKLSNLVDNAYMAKAKWCELNVIVEKFVVKYEKAYSQQGLKGIGKYTVTLVFENAIGIVSKNGIPFGFLGIPFLQIPLVNSFINCGTKYLLTGQMKGGQQSEDIPRLPDTLTWAQTGVQLDEFLKDNKRFLDPYNKGFFNENLRNSYLDTLLQQVSGIDTNRCKQKIGNILESNIKAKINFYEPELSKDDIFMKEMEKKIEEEQKLEDLKRKVRNTDPNIKEIENKLFDEELPNFDYNAHVNSLTNYYKMQYYNNEIDEDTYANNIDKVNSKAKELKKKEIDSINLQYNKGSISKTEAKNKLNNIKRKEYYYKKIIYRNTNTSFKSLDVNFDNKVIRLFYKYSKEIGMLALYFGFKNYVDMYGNDVMDNYEEEKQRIRDKYNKLIEANPENKKNLNEAMYNEIKISLKNRDSKISKGILLNSIFTGMDFFYLNKYTKNNKIYKLVKELYTYQGRINFVREKVTPLINDFIENYKIKEKLVKASLYSSIVVGKCFKYLTEWLNREKISIMEFYSKGTWPPKKEIKWDSRDYDTIVNNFSVKELVDYYMNSSLYPERLVNYLVGKGDSNKGKKIIDNLIYDKMDKYLENLLVKNLFEGVISNMVHINIFSLNQLLIRSIDTTFDIVSVANIDLFKKKLSFDTSDPEKLFITDFLLQTIGLDRAELGITQSIGDMDINTLVKFVDNKVSELDSSKVKFKYAKSPSSPNPNKPGQVLDKLKLLSEELKQIIEEFNIKKIDIRTTVVPNNNNTNTNTKNNQTLYSSNPFNNLPPEDKQKIFEKVNEINELLESDFEMYNPDLNSNSALGITGIDKLVVNFNNINKNYSIYDAAKKFLAEPLKYKITDYFYSIFLFLKDIKGTIFYKIASQYDKIKHLPSSILNLPELILNELLDLYKNSQLFFEWLIDPKLISWDSKISSLQERITIYRDQLRTIQEKKQSPDLKRKTKILYEEKEVRIDSEIKRLEKELKGIQSEKTKYNKYLSMIDAEDSNVFANYYRLINLFVTKLFSSSDTSWKEQIAEISLKEFNNVNLLEDKETFNFEFDFKNKSEILYKIITSKLTEDELGRLTDKERQYYNKIQDDLKNPNSDISKFKLNHEKIMQVMSLKQSDFKDRKKLYEEQKQLVTNLFDLNSDCYKLSKKILGPIMVLKEGSNINSIIKSLGETSTNSVSCNMHDIIGMLKNIKGDELKDYKDVITDIKNQICSQREFYCVLNPNDICCTDDINIIHSGVLEELELLFEDLYSDTNGINIEEHLESLFKEEKYSELTIFGNKIKKISKILNLRNENKKGSGRFRTLVTKVFEKKKLETILSVEQTLNTAETELSSLESIHRLDLQSSKNDSSEFKLMDPIILLTEKTRIRNLRQTITNIKSCLQNNCLFSDSEYTEFRTNYSEDISVLGSELGLVLQDLARLKGDHTRHNVDISNVLEIGTQISSLETSISNINQDNEKTRSMFVEDTSIKVEIERLLTQLRQFDFTRSTSLVIQERDSMFSKISGLRTRIQQNENKKRDYYSDKRKILDSISEAETKLTGLDSDGNYNTLDNTQQVKLEKILSEKRDYLTDQEKRKVDSLLSKNRHNQIQNGINKIIENGINSNKNLQDIQLELKDKYPFINLDISQSSKLQQYLQNSTEKKEAIISFNEKILRLKVSKDSSFYIRDLELLKNEIKDFRTSTSGEMLDESVEKELISKLVELQRSYVTEILQDTLDISNYKNYEEFATKVLGDNLNSFYSRFVNLKDINGNNLFDSNQQRTLNNVLSQEKFKANDYFDKKGLVSDIKSLKNSIPWRLDTANRLSMFNDKYQSVNLDGDYDNLNQPLLRNMLAELNRNNDEIETEQKQIIIGQLDTMLTELQGNPAITLTDQEINLMTGVIASPLTQLQRKFIDAKQLHESKLNEARQVVMDAVVSEQLSVSKEAEERKRLDEEQRKRLQQAIIDQLSHASQSQLKRRKDEAKDRAEQIKLQEESQEVTTNNIETEEVTTNTETEEVVTEEVVSNNTEEVVSIKTEEDVEESQAEEVVVEEKENSSTNKKKNTSNKEKQNTNEAEKENQNINNLSSEAAIEESENAEKNDSILSKENTRDSLLVMLSSYKQTNNLSDSDLERLINCMSELLGNKGSIDSNVVLNQILLYQQNKIKIVDDQIILTDGTSWTEETSINGSEPIDLNSIRFDNTNGIQGLRDGFNKVFGSKVYNSLRFSNEQMDKSGLNSGTSYTFKNDDDFFDVKNSEDRQISRSLDRILAQLTGDSLSLGIRGVAAGKGLLLMASTGLNFAGKAMPAVAVAQAVIGTSYEFSVNNRNDWVWETPYVEKENWFDEENDKLIEESEVFDPTKKVYPKELDEFVEYHCRSKYNIVSTRGESAKRFFTKLGNGVAMGIVGSSKFDECIKTQTENLRADFKSRFKGKDTSNKFFQKKLLGYLKQTSEIASNNKYDLKPNFKEIKEICLSIHGPKSDKCTDILKNWYDDLENLNKQSWFGSVDFIQKYIHEFMNTGDTKLNSEKILLYFKSLSKDEYNKLDLRVIKELEIALTHDLGYKYSEYETYKSKGYLSALTPQTIFYNFMNSYTGYLSLHKSSKGGAPTIKRPDNNSFESFVDEKIMHAKNEGELRAKEQVGKIGYRINQFAKNNRETLEVATKIAGQIKDTVTDPSFKEGVSFAKESWNTLKDNREFNKYLAKAIDGLQKIDFENLGNPDQVKNIEETQKWLNRIGMNDMFKKTRNGYRWTGNAEDINDLHRTFDQNLLNVLNLFPTLWDLGQNKLLKSFNVGHASFEVIMHLSNKYCKEKGDRFNDKDLIKSKELLKSFDNVFGLDYTSKAMNVARNGYEYTLGTLSTDIKALEKEFDKDSKVGKILRGN